MRWFFENRIATEGHGKSAPNMKGDEHVRA